MSGFKIRIPRDLSLAGRDLSLAGRDLSLGDRAISASSASTSATVAPEADVPESSASATYHPSAAGDAATAIDWGGVDFGDDDDDDASPPPELRPELLPSSEPDMAPVTTAPTAPGVTRWRWGPSSSPPPSLPPSPAHEEEADRRP